MTVVGIYRATDVSRGALVGPASIRDFELAAVGGYLRVTDGASVDDVRKQVDKLLVDSPEVSVGDRSDVHRPAGRRAWTGCWSMIQILLALAILVAVLGIINTLALSVLERTRELGLLRAIGLGRGADHAHGHRRGRGDLGLRRAARRGGRHRARRGGRPGAEETRASPSWPCPGSRWPPTWRSRAAVGVVAAVLPAIRAARINVLAAIAHE